MHDFQIEMMQLKQLAVELEKRHDLLQAVSEREALARENQALMEQLEAQKDKAQESPTSTNQPLDEVGLRDLYYNTDRNWLMMLLSRRASRWWSSRRGEGGDPEKDEHPRPEIKWEARTFEW